MFIIEDKFKVRINEYEEEVARYKRLYDRIAYLRFFVVLGMLYFFYEIYKTGMKSTYALGIFITIGIFILILVYHGIIKEKMLYSKDMIEINEDYLKRISGKWVEFKDKGEEFIDRSHPYSFDLDIIGEKSLFQLINTTNTYLGRVSLINTLLNPNLDRNKIKDRQEAVKELEDKLDFCQQLQYIGRSTKTRLQNPQKLFDYVENCSLFIKSSLVRKVIYILPIVTIPFALVVYLFSIEALKTLAGLLFIAQLVIWIAAALKLSAALGVMGQYKDTLEEYLKLITLIEKEEFKSKLLLEIKDVLCSKNISSIEAIRKLYNISEKINIRSNGIIYFALNILFLWDYQCIFSLESWRIKYGSSVRTWLNNIGLMEELMSFSVIYYLDPKNSFPEIEDSDPKIVAKNLGHPLIGREARINNDVNMDNHIFIVTGSNMSGKTTFLRTIGINLVLAYAGGRVCGDNMTSSLMKIYTSMRITDDVKEGISTFYGELIRIKEIIKTSEKDKNMIFLIDEIFRGTNSRDRITGAEAVLNQLEASGVIGAITTHDLELCNLDNKRIQNYHFEEHYEDNKILFDYKLRNGKSTTTNAKYLMKIVGIELKD